MRNLGCIFHSQAGVLCVFCQFPLPASKQGLTLYIFMSSKANSSASILKACVFIGLGSVCLFFSWSIQEHEPVKEVKIRRGEGQNYLKAEEILELAKIKKDHKYTSRELGSISSLLLAHPIILSASLEQKANTLYINLTERQCAAIVEDKSQKTVYDLDAEGRILSQGLSRCRQVPLLRGSFPKEGDYLHGENIKRLLGVLVQIKKAYPDLSTRFSELRINSEGSLTFFLLSSYLRIDMPFELDSIMIRRLYASVAYLSSQKIRHGWLDLRGPEAILHARAR